MFPISKCTYNKDMISKFQITPPKSNYLEASFFADTDKHITTSEFIASSNP
jgi:hypothetical protein